MLYTQGLLNMKAFI